MTIAMLVEGATEKAFIHALKRYLEGLPELKGRLPRLRAFPYDGLLPREHRLLGEVERHLKKHDRVIALTDIYTGQNLYSGAEDAKQKMRQWVNQNPRFHAHVAQHDFEAWLLPYWDKLQARAGKNMPRPTGSPESVNHQKPPAKRIDELFRKGNRSYSKVLDGSKILESVNLQLAIDQCPELKSLVNTIIELAKK
jgi:hypothetical protein